MDRQIYQIFESLKREINSKKSSQYLDQAYQSIVQIIHMRYETDMFDVLNQMKSIEWNDNLLIKE